MYEAKRWQNRSDESRLDCCPECKNNFLSFDAYDCHRNDDDEWIMPLSCDDCAHSLTLNADDLTFAKLQALQINSSHQIENDVQKLATLTANDLAYKLARTGFLPLIGGRE